MLCSIKFLLRYLFFCILLGMHNFAHAQEIYFASWGGAYQRALEKAWLDPFSNETGIEVMKWDVSNYEETTSCISEIYKKHSSIKIKISKNNIKSSLKCNFS